LPGEKTPKSRWKFAISCVIAVIKQRKSPTSSLLTIPWRRLKEWETAFKLFHWKLRHTQPVSPADQALYDSIIYTLDFQTICEWTTHVLAICEKETKAEEAKKPGFFSSLWGHSAASPSVDYESLLQDLDYSEDGDPLLPPENYTWLQVAFELPLSSLTLLRRKSAEDCEGLSIKVDSAVINFQMERESYAVDISLNDTCGEAWERSNSRTSSVPFYRRAQLAKGKILQICHQSNPSHFSCQSQTTIRTQPVEVIYSQQVLEKAASFFLRVHAEQAVKTAAWDKLHSLGNSTNQQISRVLRSSERRIIELDLSAPVLIVPSSSTPTEAFKLSLGRFQISNRNGGKHREMYEEMTVTVTDVKVRYEAGDRAYPLLEPVAFTLRAEFLNGSHRKSKKAAQATEVDKMPDIRLSGRLEALRVNCTYSIYRLLIETLARVKTHEEALSALSMDKKTLMKAASGFDLVTKEGGKGWISFFCVLSQDCLYFFNSPNDTTASAYYHIQDCRLETDAMVAGNPFVLRLKGKFGHCSLAFSSSDLLLKWQTLLMACISEPFLSHSSDQQSTKSLETRKILSQKAKMAIELEIQQIAGHLTDDALESWFVMEIAEVKITANRGFYRANYEVKLRKLEMVDRRVRSSERFYTLAKSMDEEQGLIDLSFTSLSPLHPDYSGVNSTCEVRFHHMSLCWNQETMVDLLNFLQFQPSKGGPEPGTEGKCVGSGTVLFLLKTHFDKVDLLLNNVQSEVTIAKASVQEFDMTLKSYVCKAEIEGQLGNMCVYDLTDYPRTALKKYMENPAPFCLFSLREGLHQLLRFSVKSYSPFCQEITKDCDLVLDFHLSSVQLAYLHQPILRIVDYFINKMLGLFDKQ